MTNNYRSPVGRNSPPIGRQFGQGQKRGEGRPKGATGMKTIVQKLARQMHHVPQFENPITTVELLLLQLRILRLKGDIRALKFTDSYFSRFQPIDSDVGGWLVVPQSMSTEAFIEHQMKLNQLRTDPSLNDPSTPLPLIVS
jgi:hypothetical protein